MNAIKYFLKTHFYLVSLFVFSLLSQGQSQYFTIMYSQFSFVQTIYFLKGALDPTRLSDSELWLKWNAFFFFNTLQILFPTSYFGVSFRKGPLHSRYGEEQLEQPNTVAVYIWACEYFKTSLKRCEPILVQIIVPRGTFYGSQSSFLLSHQT